MSNFAVFHHFLLCLRTAKDGNFQNSFIVYSKTFIHETSTDLHKVTLQPEDENEDIKIRYEYHLNKSRTVEVKFITVWTNGTYIPIPVFIYDKSLGCAFEYYSEISEGENPFSLSISQ